MLIKTQLQKFLTIGVVEYLNARPLIYGMGDTANGTKILLDTPRKIAHSFRRGEKDVALIPVIEYAQTGEGAIVPGICIASTGEVTSVLLVAKTSVDQIKTLALDIDSLSSVALLKILCLEKFHIMPKFIDHKADLSFLKEKDIDAMLVIGDSAMTSDLRPFPYVYDLGAEWWDLTGLPFVYAFWLAREERLDRFLIERLTTAKRQGLKNIEAIAKEGALRLGLPVETCQTYLQTKIGYDLGESEIEGLNRFYNLCTKHRICPKAPSILI